MNGFHFSFRVWLLFWCSTLFFTKVFSIHCYYCQSTVSWEHCDTSLNKVNCSQYYPRVSFDTCVQQYEVQVNKTGSKIPNTDYYTRKCGTENHCQDVFGECERHGRQCQSQCCATDYCNNAVYSAVDRNTLSAYLLVGVAVMQYICSLLCG